MSTQITLPIARAFAASNVFTFTTPGDAGSGIASTTWTPVLAEVARVAPAGAPRADRLAAFSQLVAELRRVKAEIPRSRALGPTERLAFGTFVEALLLNAQTSLDAI